MAQRKEIAKKDTRNWAEYNEQPVRRIRRLNIQISEYQRKDTVIAIDSRETKVTDRGEWLREKWKLMCLHELCNTAER